MQKVLMRLLAAMIAVFAVSATPAYAQATRTWISGVGDDVNPCSRTAPCKTFAGAISKTAAGGEINCLDPGGFGAVTITKAITLNCTGTLGSILASGTNGIVINAGATDKVQLIGLDINGAGGTLGINGITIQSARDVSVTNVRIRNFSNSGIKLNASVSLRVTVNQVEIVNAGTGILVQPNGGANSAKVSNTLLSANATAGISLQGSLATGYVSNVVILGTPKSLDIQSGAVLSSYGNNLLNGGTTDTPTPATLQ